MLSAINKLKSLLRDFIPQKYQTVVKYYYNRINSTLEPELQILDYLVRKNDLVVDVGGNRGIYAYRLWKLGAKVEVFEPNPTCFKLLNSWAENKPNVNINMVALSNNDGTANLHIPVDDFGVEHDASASIENIEFEHSRDELVTLHTLDSQRFENVIFIKIDVEGHEFNVIEGATSIISNSKPALLVEIEQRHNSRPIEEVFDRILELGYIGFFLRKDALTPLENFDASLHQSIENFNSANEEYINNFLFLHTDKVVNDEYCILFESLELS